MSSPDVVGRRRSESLTPRERDVLVWAGRGLTADQTGARMGIAASTVKDLRCNALRRLDAVCLTQALSVAIRRGDLSVDQL
jgi:DNA-binding CsgD family transcriptional regulator